MMKAHKWNVGCLGELYPEGQVGVSDVCVLGLNENKGKYRLSSFLSLDISALTACFGRCDNIK